MRGTNIITINGRPYDAITGMPIKSGTASVSTKPQLTHVAPKTHPAHHSQGRVMSDVGARPAHHQMPAKPKTAPAAHSTAVAPKPPVHAPATHAAHQVHQQTQRSKTLHRASLARPAIHAATKPAEPIKRSPLINKFSSVSSKTTHSHHTAVAAKPETIAPAQQHPVVARVEAHKTKAIDHKKAEALKGKELKEHLIKEQMRRINTDEQPRKHTFSKRHPRMAAIVTSVAALVILGGYLTYLNLPSLSIRVAATQAGVNASYPTYQPSGYSFAGPVAFSPGEVRINFNSNTNDYQFSLVQRSSSWDSQAVLDNYVTKESAQYATLQERGLTIYLLENKAAWVNGGVFYVIDGNAPLSSEQIQKIASSTL